eukprot:TRINITY_DN4174_c0_g1_i6.p1 TRINITY_DN4174_c0_g1~~TRINITY_DN4174_c0_g1_i6.p1  ORF type:complete len:1271 (+),score=302.99 TRINITY_DN4174_c0_g1_i6:73-3885(+)
MASNDSPHTTLQHNAFEISAKDIEIRDGSDDDNEFNSEHIEDHNDDGDDDYIDDLMRQQREFFTRKQPPSATVKSFSKKNATANVVKESVTKEQIAAKFDNLVFDVKENNPDTIAFTPPKVRSGAFPPSMKQEEWEKIRAQKLKQSRFAKAASSQKNVSTTFSHESPHLGSHEKPLSHEIHQENLVKLQSMSKQDIEEAQEDIKSAIQPKLLEFLKKRSVQKSSKETLKETPQTREIEKELDTLKLDIQERPKSEVDFRDAQSTIGKLDPRSNVAEGIYIPASEVEKAKLEWIMPAEPTKVDLKAKQQPSNYRFGFQGEVIAPDTDIDTSRGLHHHGEEPDLAGYTIAELFHLSRSKMPNQRTVSIQILGYIMFKAKSGEYENDVWSTLEHYNIGLLMRCAIDDPNTTALMTALQALHSMIVSNYAEETLEKQELLFRGMQNLPLLPTDSLQTKDGPKFAEMSDSEVMKVDLIAGLVRTNLIDRIKYLMKTVKFMGVDILLDILCQCARHSLTTCVEITEDQGFTEFIKRSFICVTEKPKKGHETYNSVNSKAIKLVRLLCQAGRGIARELCDVDLLSGIGSILSGNNDAAKYQSILLLRTLACYSMHCNSFLDLFPLLSQPWEHVTVVFENLESLSSSSSSIDVDAAIAGLLDQLAHASAFSPVGDQVFGSAASQVDSVIQGLRSLLSLKASWAQLDPSSALIGNLFHFLASYHQHIQNHDGLDPVSVVSMTEKIADLALAFLQTWEPLNPQYVKAAISMNTAKKATYLENLPIIVNNNIKETSRANVLLGLVRLIYFSVKVHKGLLQKIKQKKLDSVLHQLLSSVLAAIPFEIDQDAKMYHLQPLRIHTICAYYLIKLLDDIQLDSLKAVLVYQAAVRIIGFFNPGDETYACDLVSSIILNPHYLKLIQVYTGIQTDDGRTSQASWGAWIRSHLVDTYTKILAPTDQIVTRSEALATFRGSTLPSLLLPSAMSSLPKTTAWFLHPMQYIPPADSSRESNPLSNAKSRMSQDAMVALLDFLSLVFGMEVKSVYREHSGRSLRLWFFSYLHLFFEERNYRNEDTASRIQAFLQSWCSEYQLAGAPALGSEFDYLLEKLVGPFIADSMGDQTFTEFMLLFMRQKESSVRRLRILKEILPIARSFSADSFPTGNDEFLFPMEDNQDIIEFLILSLSMFHGLKSLSPLMYWYCIHHISGAIFSDLEKAKIGNLATHYLEAVIERLRQETVFDIIEYEYHANTFPGRKKTRPQNFDMRLGILGALKGGEAIVSN